MSKLLKNKNFIYSIFILIFATIILLGSFSFSSGKANAESQTSSALQSNQAFTVSVTDRKSGQESSDFSQTSIPYTDYASSSLKSGKGFVYQWEDIYSFKFKYNPNVGEAPPKLYTNPSRPQTEYYELKISIDYIQSYKDLDDFYQGSTKSLINVFSTRVSGIDSYKLLATLPDSFAFYLDDGRGNESVKIKEWGIYRFLLDINGQQTYSDFFVVEPTKEIKSEKAPVFSYTTTSSQSSLHNDYIFTVTNLDQYRYIDSSKLVWYVTGKSDDGIMYVLADKDRELEQFKNKAYTGLYAKEINRTGLTFRFDDTGVAGSWKIWCEYNYQDSEIEPLVSKVVEFSTGTPLSSGIIVWSVLGVFAVGIVLVIIFSLRRAKKDKVY